MSRTDETGYLTELTCDLLVVGHTHQPRWYRSPAGRLVVIHGSLVSVPVIDTSRTFAVVELAKFEVAFHDLETGNPVPLDPWV